MSLFILLIKEGGLPFIQIGIFILTVMYIGSFIFERINDRKEKADKRKKK